MVYALEECYNHNYIESLEDYIKNIIKYVNDGDKGNHRKGMLKLIKQKRWEKWKAKTNKKLTVIPFTVS